MGKNKLEHHELNETEKKNFERLYYQIESDYPIFNLMKQNLATMIAWILYVLGFMIFFIVIGVNEISFYSCTKYIALFCLGVFALQIIFVAAHVKSHALFLEYDKHCLDVTKDNDVLTQQPIYFYAFYHHHHSITNDWMPELSYCSNKNQFVLDHEGTRNITASHWHGFSMLSSKNILIVVFLVMICPNLVFYFFGYEIGVFILPFAHGWQHIPKKNFRKLQTLFSTLEYFGLLANKHDHNNHHKHDSPTVYQDFSSSGLYAKRIDKLINTFWDQIYNKNEKPHDEMKYYVTFVYLIIILLVPIFISLMSLEFVSV